MHIAQFTTRYSSVQDRFRLDGVSTCGVHVCLWLTQRLLRQLLPVVFKMTAPDEGDAPRRAALGSWTFAGARDTHRPTPPVPSVAGTDDSAPDAAIASSWLIHSLQVHASPDMAHLTFRVNERQAVAVISFTPVQLRQWLIILCRIWRRTGWPMHDWPHWLVQLDAPESVAGTVVQ